MSYFADHFDEEDPITEEFANNLLRQIESGACPYLDADDLLDSHDLLMQLNRIDDARRLLDYALTIHPENIEVLLLQATILIDDNKIANAKSLLDYIAPKAQNEPYYYVNIGWMHLKSGHLKEALVAFDEAVAIPANKEGHATMVFEIASNLSEMEYFDESMRYFSQIPKATIENNPTFEFSYAYTLDRIGREDESLRSYEHLIKKSPLMDVAWYNLGIIYNKRNLLTEAIEAYSNAVAINPLYAEPYYNIANTYVSLGEPLKAIENYTEYLSLSPDGAEFSAYQYIGECWEDLECYSLALKFYTLSVQKDPTNDAAWYEIGRCYVELGNNAKGILCFEKAISHNSSIAEYYFAMAQARYNIMDMEKAVELLEKGLSLSPNDVLAWFEVIRIRVSLADSNFDLRAYIHKQKTAFGPLAALQIIEAYVEFFVYGKKNVATNLMRDVACTTPQAILDASVEPTLNKLFEKKEIVKVLNEYNIRF